MKNNKGIGKFEVLTMMVIGMVVVVLVLWYFVGVAGRERFTTMKKNVFTFKKSVIGNMDEFNNYGVAYLGEAITGGFIPAIKSPFSGNYCSPSESKVVVENNKARVTLRCDNYLVDNSAIKTEVSNIKNLSSDVINELKCGDIISKKTGNQYHNYIVTYKEEKR